MGYKAIGGISITDLAETKSLCESSRKDMDTKLAALENKLQAKIDNVGGSQLKIIKNQLDAVVASVSSFKSTLEILSTRLDTLEDVAANLELATNEILEIWEAKE